MMTTRTNHTQQTKKRYRVINGIVHEEGEKPFGYYFDEPIICNGIELDSRYNAIHEIDTMEKVAECLEREVARKVISIFCDSKACACYTVRLREKDCHVVERIEKILFTITGGYNNLIFKDKDGNAFYNFEANWMEYMPGFDDCDATNWSVAFSLSVIWQQNNPDAKLIDSTGLPMHFSDN
jgi:hypothetical protein